MEALSLVVKHIQHSKNTAVISPWPTLLCKLQRKSSAVSSVHFWSAGQADTTVDHHVYCTHSPKEQACSNYNIKFAAPGSD